ncbi:GvpL/GvpF family gas vesicle protein [Salipaludibacillus neizhouensis]|uniref:GvpL/GvpF family gas vesicle protein n=1 Tax=Salipaludibacillus neizhouensis TaxID=885475 RepID=UPI0015FEF17D|nr:GvpL/GvpF family gas vesicle protein [Salipaludibacillus neizhouensis]
MNELENEELIYVYAFLPAQEASSEKITGIKGIDPNNEVKFHTRTELTAVICKVPATDFAEENFKQNVENIKWLQQRASHHHELMNTLHDKFTILPLKFGTIYENEERLEQMMSEYYEQMKTILEEVQDKEEWNLKIYSDPQVFSKKVLEENREIEAKKKEISELSKGKQFFARKKLDQFITDQIKAETEKKCKEVHDKILKFSQNAEVKKNWEQKVTGRDDEMSWNCVYLMETGENVEAFTRLVEEYQKHSVEENEGLLFESTGPWPAYHFANFKCLTNSVKS